MNVAAIPEVPDQADPSPGEADQVLRHAGARRDPRAASFAADAWPFRGHRTLAEVDAEVRAL